MREAPGWAPSLGLIEAYYGEPWSWTARQATITFLAARGYGFHIYAPKADPYLRRRWREDYPAETLSHLDVLASHCHALGVRFGVGLSPFELYRNFDDDARVALKRKLDALTSLGLDDLALLFDDMRGDLPDLAVRQAQIVDYVAQHTGASRILVCPTYYSDDPILDRAFGQRPPTYLADLGAALDPAIAIFWTGEEVCSRAYSPGHLDRVAGELGRPPFLWDNYPVNDGPVMSQALHLRAFTGRPAAIGDHIAAHAINPALQPILTRIPALTLAESYRLGEAYQYSGALGRAASEVLGPELGLQVVRRLGILQDQGLDRLGEAAGRLRARFAAYDHDGAREIVAWLDGDYRVTRVTMDAQ